MEDISIHAPRTGSDPKRVHACSNLWYFNPRSPHGERHHTFYISPHGQDFNPRSPHGERPPTRVMRYCCSWLISIHAPRTGSDFAWMQKPPRCLHFNPRSPHGERRAFQATSGGTGYDFNPRSPHGERRAQNLLRIPRLHFNPRSPHGERPGERSARTTADQFQSTLPARGATRAGSVLCFP